MPDDVIDVEVTGTDLVKAEPPAVALRVVVTADELVARRAAVMDVFRKLMVKGLHYVTLPSKRGDTRPFLSKAGAEMLCTTFGLRPEFDYQVESDLVGERHNGVPYYGVHCTCRLFSGDRQVGSGVGMCSSWESKYHKRYDGTLVPPMEVANTILKMAAKRAYVGATIFTLASSDIFHQDDDVVIAAQVSGPDHIRAAAGQARDRKVAVNALTAAFKMRNVPTNGALRRYICDVLFSEEPEGEPGSKFDPDTASAAQYDRVREKLLALEDDELQCLIVEFAESQRQEAPRAAVVPPAETDPFADELPHDE